MQAFILDDARPVLNSVSSMPDVGAARGLMLGTLLGAIVWIALGAAVYLSLLS
jgi:hypothetical protein